jgi:hypothetical protein
MTSHKKPSHLKVAIGLLLSLYANGCDGVRSDTPTTQTTNRLKLWRDAFSDALENGCDPIKYKSLSDFVRDWDNKTETMLYVRKAYVGYDEWGRLFDLKIKKEEDLITIRILSKGENGKYENGEGDDLFVIITQKKGRKPKSVLKK